MSSDPSKPLPTQATTTAQLNCANDDLLTPVESKYVFFKRSHGKFLRSTVVYWDNATDKYYLPNNYYQLAEHNLKLEDIIFSCREYTRA